MGSSAMSNGVYNGTKFPNLTENEAINLTNQFTNAMNNKPTNRNAPFFIPGANQTPGVLGLANAPTVGAKFRPEVITNEPVAGTQFNGISLSDVAGFPIEAPFNTGE